MSINLGFLLLVACTTVSPWKFDSIETNEKAFDSSRLVYSDSTNPSLRFEMICLETGIESFINLTKYKFHTTENGLLQVTFETDGERCDEMVPLLEGRMRLRLSENRTNEIIKSLQNGKEVVILVDGFEQTIHPDQFMKFYTLFNGNFE